MFKKETREWQGAINRYDRTAAKLFKKIKISLKKKNLNKEESKKLIEHFSKKLV